MVSDIEIMNRGIHCLLEKLGVVETERFIAVINREQFDYTKWQQERFDYMSSDDFNNAAVAYSKENPFYKKNQVKEKYYTIFTRTVIAVMKINKMH